MRLHVYLAQRGVASRRTCERLIADGRVKLNGNTVKQMGLRVGSDDEILVDSRPVADVAVVRYLALNKPPGFVCSSADPAGRPTALDLLPDDVRLFSVGRLDAASSGLLLFTTDGDFSQRASHPSYGVQKEYQVQAADGAVIPSDLLERYRVGLAVDGERFRLAAYRRRSAGEVILNLTTGKNREIRRVFASVGIDLERVHRIRVGPVSVDGLGLASHRSLTSDEVKWFKSRRQTRSSR